MPQGRQCKGGSSKSSTSSSSSQRSGGGSNNRHGNTTANSSDRGRNSRRSFSGSSDSSDDGKDDDDKRRIPYRRKKKEPKSKPGFSDEEDDDEATDSADEGRSQDTPNSMTLDFSPQSQKGARRRSGSKDRFRPSDIPSGLSSKTRSSNGSSSSTISVESIKGASRSEMGAHVPPSPVNMAVGYGVPSSAAPLVLEPSQSKSPMESSKELLLGTPTVDSPRSLALKANSPGTPPAAMSPEIPPTFTGEVIY